MSIVLRALKYLVAFVVGGGLGSTLTATAHGLSALDAAAGPACGLIGAIYEEPGFCQRLPSRWQQVEWPISVQQDTKSDQPIGRIDLLNQQGRSTHLNVARTSVRNGATCAIQLPVGDENLSMSGGTDRQQALWPGEATTILYHDKENNRLSARFIVTLRSVSSSTFPYTCFFSILRVPAQ